MKRFYSLNVPVEFKTRMATPFEDKMLLTYSFVESDPRHETTNNFYYIDSMEKVHEILDEYGILKEAKIGDIKWHRNSFEYDIRRRILFDERVTTKTITLRGDVDFRQYINKWLAHPESEDGG
jgi:hypothetical protein